MSKSSELDKVVKLYIISCITSEGYNVVEPVTNQEKIDFLRSTFNNEYGFNIARMGEQNALKEWFQGLPSSISVAFYNTDILDLAFKWGSISSTVTESQEQKILDNYFNLLAAKTCQLFKGYRVPKETI